MTVNLFDVNYYRGTNPDLRTAGLTTDTQLVDHFLRFGINDGRPFSPFVNLDFYRAGNPDLAAGGVNTNLQAFYHLQSFGIADGRRFSYGLNVPFYAAVNPDLALAGINNNEQRFEHFRAAGLNDGRVSAENFNVRYYLDANPDLRAAGLNFAQAFQHYVNYGFREGRPAVPGGSTPPPPQGEPGNNPSAAFNVDVLTGTRNFNEFVGFNDRDDYYRFSLQLPSDFILSLDSTTAFVNVDLYQDTNSNGQIDSNERVTGTSTNSNGAISSRLGAGTYFVRLQPDSQGRNTNYSLGLTANNTRDGLIDAGLLNGSRTFTEFVGRTDREDFYRFVLGTPSNFRLTLNGTTAFVEVDLYVDTNGNGQIDSNERVTGTSTNSNGAISRSLGADTYFVVVSTGSSSNSNYTLNLATV